MLSGKSGRPLFVQAINLSLLQLPLQVVLPGVAAQKDSPLGAKLCQHGAEKNMSELAAKLPKVPSDWAGARAPLCNLLALAFQSCTCEVLGLFCLLSAGGSWGLGVGRPESQVTSPGRPVQGKRKEHSFQDRATDSLL